MTIADRHFENLEITPVDAHNTEIAVSLLHRFFQEEGFSGDPSIIAANLDRMRRDDNHWVAVALNNRHIVGIVTVTSMLLDPRPWVLWMQRPRRCGGGAGT